MSYLKEQHLVQEEHFPALDFKCGDDRHILIYTFSCKFLGGKKTHHFGRTNENR